MVDGWMVEVHGMGRWRHDVNKEQTTLGSSLIKSRLIPNKNTLKQIGSLFVVKPRGRDGVVFDEML